MAVRSARWAYVIATAALAGAAGLWAMHGATDLAGSVGSNWGAGTFGRWTIIWALLFVAAVISSTVGFAYAAVAGCMLLHFVPNPVEAVQIIMVASIGLQGYSVAALHRSIRWSRCLPIIGGGIAAMPIGVTLLLCLQQRAYAPLLGAALVVYGLHMQFRRPASSVSGERRFAAIAVGAIGGITGPIAAFPAACLVMWCGMRGWDKLTQRAVYQPYILVMQVVGLAAIVTLRPGSLDPALLACALPGLAGAVVGLRIFRALTDLHFHRAVHAALIASGAALLLK